MNPPTAHALSEPPAARQADLNGLRRLVEHDLARVNALIVEQSQSEIALISNVAAHIVAAGGKRLRPSLTLAAATLCGYVGDRHVRLAACVEFIHTATLLHDDVVDASELRRGEQTANAVFGNQSSVLVGDFLFSRAFQLMVADGSLEVLKILADASATISEGEVQQLMLSHDLAITRAQYEQIIAAKTAALFAAACEIGAIVGARPGNQHALRSYGHALGMAFQLADDALDYASNNDALGKTIGDDFREGKVTMPVMLAYQRGDAQERAFWQAAMEKEATFSPAQLREATRLLVRHEAIDATLRIAEQYRDQAQAALGHFSASPAKNALMEAADFAVHRVS